MTAEPEQQQVRDLLEDIEAGRVTEAAAAAGTVFRLAREGGGTHDVTELVNSVAELVKRGWRPQHSTDWHVVSLSAMGAARLERMRGQLQTF